jgi:hypothetical protein
VISGLQLCVFVCGWAQEKQAATVDDHAALACVIVLLCAIHASVYPGANRVLD